MNKLSLPISILAILGCIASFFYFQSSKSDQVYVDINKLVDGYKRTAIVKADFDKKAATMQANVDSLMGNWQKELQTYEKERSSMSKKELALQQELLATNNNKSITIAKQFKNNFRKKTRNLPKQ